MRRPVSWLSLSVLVPWLVAACGPSDEAPQKEPSDDLPVAILSLDVTPREAVAGSPVTLRWSAEHATACALTGQGAVGTSGEVQTSVSVTTDFTLTCQGLQGPATRTARVTVAAPTSVRIVSFSASASPVRYGATATLSWTTTGATGCTLSPGNLSVSAQGSTAVSPTRSTLYTLTCRDASAAAASDTEWVKVTVPVSELFTGTEHSCALLENGRVKCWGANTEAQLGLGDHQDRGSLSSHTGDSLPAVDLGTGRTAQQLALGERHTCALLTDGAVKCWGANASGQLGLGHTREVGGASGQMGDALPTVNLGAGRTALSLVAGKDFTCALLDGGQVKCWGLNDRGQLGQGRTGNVGDAAGELGATLPAVDLGTGRTARGLSAGFDHVCALLDDARVKCWGGNANGQLGQGDVTNRGTSFGQLGDALPAVSLGTGRTARSVLAGSLFSCALMDNGQVKCWGRNNVGQLGQGNITNRGDGAGEMGDALAVTSLGTGVKALAGTAGGGHACARLQDDTLKCWGFNDEGQLGLGDTNRRGDTAGEMGSALPAVLLGTGRSALSVAPGRTHTCAVLDDGSARCWGGNARGQLGLGTSTPALGDQASETGNGLPALDLGS